MKVCKFGGTSVGTPERMKHVGSLIETQQNIVVVLSAVAKTTDTLAGISTDLKNRKTERAIQQLNQLTAYYDQYMAALFSTKSSLKNAKQAAAGCFQLIHRFINAEYTSRTERAILAQGEIISTHLLHFYLLEKDIANVLIPALDILRLDATHEPDIHHLRKQLREQIERHPEVSLFITQGYICRDINGEISNLKRGGSDYSASLIGAALESSEIQIWTDIDGMHNNDPRYVQNTHPIREISFSEAAELAYFGAKILHPSSILPAKKFNIPVRLLNTINPETPGTLITAQNIAKGSVKAIAAKDGITVIKIKSSRMLLAYGFLRKVFEIFERYQTPIDVICTSEVAVSLTIDDPTHLEDILQELRNYGVVNTDSEQSIICVVGNFLTKQPNTVLKVITSLEGIPLRMISYGGSAHNITLVTQSSYKTKALNALHEGLFNV